MFKQKQAPDDLEFPACVECNHPTSNDDLLIAWLGRMDPEAGRGDDDGRLPGLMVAMHHQFPGLLPSMLLSVREARRINAALGRRPAKGETHTEAASAVKVTDEVERAICTIGRKLAKGLYYRELGACLPTNGCILMMWEVGVRVGDSFAFPMVDSVRDMAGARTPAVQRNRKSLQDQFTYHLAHCPVEERLLVGARFRSAIGMLLFASGIPGQLEATIADTTDSAGYVLQSPIMSLHPNA